MTSFTTTANAAGSDGRRFRAAAAWALLAAALWFRSAGLSHDVLLGNVYHPDTPKQVNAVREFLGGRYMVVRDHPDYDAYPLFNSHLVEYTIRIVRRAQWTVARHVVGPQAPAPAPLSMQALFLWVRGWNTLLSVAAIVLVWRIGRRRGLASALLAAGLMLFSPLDFTAAHFAANDTAAAFFCVAAIWFGVRVAERGCYRDYLLGAFSVAAAFSSKYHGGMAAAALAAGHFAFHGGRGGIASVAAWRRIGLTFLAGALGVLLTSPALLINPARAFHDLLGFFAWTANFGLPSRARALPWPARLWMGWRANWPQIGAAAGWLTLVAASGACWWRRREPWLWVVAAVPLVHLTLGVGGKPHLHAVHHTPVMAPLFLLAAAGVTALARRGGWARALAVVLALLALGRNAVVSAREAFFFRRNDTRYVAETWAAGNLPADWIVRAGRYTFSDAAWTNRLPNGRPRVDVLSGRFAPPDGRPPPWARIALDESPFTIFRNRDQWFFTAEHPLLSPRARAPAFIAQPEAGVADWVLADLPEWNRSFRVRDFDRNAPLDLTVAAPGRLTNVWLLLYAGGAPARVRTTFGGRTFRKTLAAGEAVCLPVDAPRSRAWPRSRGLCFYDWRAEAEWGRARVALAVRPEEAGEWCFRFGLRKQAAELLTGADAARDPLRAFLRDLSSGRAATPPDAARIRAVYGIHPDAVSDLPLLTVTGRLWTAAAVGGERTLPDGAPLLTAAPLPLAPPLTIFTGPEIWLTPGVYRVEWTWPDNAPVSARCDWLLPDGRPWRSEGDAADGIPSRAELAVRRETAALRPRVIVSGGDTPRPELRVYPAWEADAAGMRRLAENVPTLGSAPAIFFQGLETNDVEFARPTRTQATDTRFAEGWRLREIRLLQRAGRIGINLAWVVDDATPAPGELSAWVHLLDAAGNKRTQCDRPLRGDLRRAARADEVQDWYVLPLAEPLPPGEYRVRIGLWRAHTRRRLDLRSSDLPRGKKYVELPLVIP